VWGLDFGLPLVVHADEPIVVNHALAFGLGDLNPHFFNIPPLTSYILFLSLGCYYLTGFLLGTFASAPAFLFSILEDPTAIYLIGRSLIGVFFGLLSIVFMYRTGRVVWTRPFAMLGSFMMAVLFLPVQLSHFIYPDSPLLFSITLSLFFIFKVAKKSRWKDFLGAAFAIGLALSIKYNALLLILPFLAAFMVAQNRDLRKLVLSFLFLGGICFILNPYFFLDFAFAWGELQEQSSATGFVGWFHHLNYSLRAGLGLPLLLFFILSLVLSFKKLFHKKSVLIMAITTLVFYLHLVFFAQPYARYGILLIPSVIFFSVEGLRLLYQRFPKVWYVGIMVASLVIIPIYQDVLLGKVLSSGDTRNEAKEWMLRHLPQGSSIYLDHPRFQPRLSLCKSQLEASLKSARKGSAQARRLEALIQLSDGEKTCFRVYYPTPDTPQLQKEFLLQGDFLSLNREAFKKAGVQHFALARLGANHPDKEELAFINRYGTLVARFSPYHDTNQDESLDTIDLTGAPTTLEDLRSRRLNGHIIEIYKLNF